MAASSAPELIAGFRNQTTAALDQLAEAVDTTFSLGAASIIFLMQCGFGMLEAGSVREKSTRDILMKNLLDFAVGSLAWFFIGFMLAADGGAPFIGFPGQNGAGSTITPFDAVQRVHGVDVAHYLMSLMYAVTSATIVSGAMAERTQIRAYLVSSSIMTALTYPVVVHWVWSDRGWLSTRSSGAVFGGAFDFAGGGVVHVTGGFTALVAAWSAGPRTGRFDGLRTQPMRGHSSVLVVLGTMLLLVGWLGFNSGSIASISAPGAPVVAAQTAKRTVAAGGVSMLVVAAAVRAINKTWSVERACNGLLAGLVSITAGAPAVSDFASLAIGAAGGLLYLLVSCAVERSRTDDVLDAFAVHGACGLWSLMAVGLMADLQSPPVEVLPTLRGALTGGDGSLLAAQLIASVSIAAWSLALGLLTFLPLRALGLLRIDQDAELTGVDLVELGGSAYDTVSSSTQGAAPPARAAWRPVSPTDPIPGHINGVAPGTPLTMRTDRPVELNGETDVQLDANVASGDGLGGRMGTPLPTDHPSQMVGEVAMGVAVP